MKREFLAKETLTEGGTKIHIQLLRSMHRHDTPFQVISVLGNWIPAVLGVFSFAFVALISISMLTALALNYVNISCVSFITIYRLNYSLRIHRMCGDNPCMRFGSHLSTFFSNLKKIAVHKNISLCIFHTNLQATVSNY